MLCDHFKLRSIEVAAEHRTLIRILRFIKMALAEVLPICNERFEGDLTAKRALEIPQMSMNPNVLDINTGIFTFRSTNYTINTHFLHLFRYRIDRDVRHRGRAELDLTVDDVPEQKLKMM